MLKDLFNKKKDEDTQGGGLYNQASHAQDNQEDIPPAPEGGNNKKSKFNIKNILIVVVLVILVGLAAVKKFSSGGTKEGGLDLSKVEIPIDEMSKDLKDMLLVENIDILSDIEEVEIKDIENLPLDEGEVLEIKNKIDGKPTSAKYKLAASAVSIDARVDFEALLTYAKHEAGGKTIITKINGELSPEDTWVYSPESPASITDIMAALRTIKFKGFHDEYIGSPDNTNIEVKERNFVAEKGIDNVTVVVNITNELLDYKLKGDLFFEFGKDGWKMVNETISIKPDWGEVDYKINTKPNIYEKEYILNLVSSENSIFNKVIDLNNMKKYSLDDVKVRPIQDGVALDYNLNVEYEDLSIITYTIRIPFEWTGSTWAEQEAQVEVESAIFINSLGSWINPSNGDVLLLTDVTAPETKRKDIEGLKGILYTRAKNGSLSPQEFSIDVDIPLRSDNYTGVISEYKEGKNLDVIFDLATKEIVIGNNKFKKANKHVGHNDEIDIDAVKKESIKRHIKEGDYPSIEDIRAHDKGRVKIEKGDEDIKDQEVKEGEDSKEDKSEKEDEAKDNDKDEGKKDDKKDAEDVKDNDKGKEVKEEKVDKDEDKKDEEVKKEDNKEETDKEKEESDD